ncbi:transposase, partial [Bacillus anthracis]|uniref:transposase n=1 Tax=Bacillus anthracis TaxID=1392 RepID=UPI0039A73518
MSLYSHLSVEEREQVSLLRKAGQSIRGIGRALCRSASTISRELRRNQLASGNYSARHGDGSYLFRRQRHNLIEKDERLCTFVINRLSEGWSPEQISGWLKSGNEKGLHGMATETIYA